MIHRFFFSATFPPGWLPLLRCGTGILLLLTGIQLWPDFDILYGPGSIVDHRLLRVGGDSFLPMGGTSRGYLAAYIVCCALLVWGRWARLWAILLCFLHHQLYTAQPAFSYGFDYIAASALFYCAWFPVGNPESRWATPCLRVLQLHLCLIYFFGGLDKIIGPTWHNGEALWKAIHLPDLNGAWRPDTALLAQHPTVLALLGWMVILLEVAYPAVIWLRRLRAPWLCGIIGVHAGIALFMGLYHFSAVMMVLNLCAFYLPYRNPSSLSKQIVNQYQQPATSSFQRTDPPKEMRDNAPQPNAQDA